MDKIKINHETPLCLLKDSKNFNDYEFILPHLLDQSEEYKEYMVEAKNQGRYIIMDNSLHELKNITGEAYSKDRLVYWVNELNPNEFIIPDVWEDKTHSVVNAVEWSKIKLPELVTKVAVVQAKSLHEAMECYQAYKDLGYQKIAFSYGASYYNEVCPHINKDLGKALGRVQVISQLYDWKVINRTDRVHLLGTSYPAEFGWYKNFPFIESCDTSNPIMATIDNLVYNGIGLYNKPKANMNDAFNISIEKINLTLLDHNVKMFRIINNI